MLNAHLYLCDLKKTVPRKTFDLEIYFRRRHESRSKCYRNKWPETTTTTTKSIEYNVTFHVPFEICISGSYLLYGLLTEMRVEEHCFQIET